MQNTSFEPSELYLALLESLGGENGDKLLLLKVEPVFPTAERALSYADCATCLNLLRKDPLWEFLSTDAQFVFGSAVQKWHVAEIVIRFATKMQRGCPPRKLFTELLA